MIPLLIVSATSPPAKYAPANSNTIAMIIACLTVIVPEPTEVPMAFETSFAPIPKAIKKPSTAVIITNIEPYSCNSCINSPMLLPALAQYVNQYVELDQLRC